MNPEAVMYLTPRMLVVILDRDQRGKLEDILREKHVHLHYMFQGMGTASSEILRAFGLSGTEKTVCLCIQPAQTVHTLMTAVVERLEFTRPGRGIAFILPVSGVSAAVSHMLNDEMEQYKQKGMELMDKDAQAAMEEARFELVIAVVNQGFSEEVMDAARSAGVKGGTIVNARRSGLEDAVKFFGISLQAEKELVSIVVPRGRKKALMQAISAACGVRTEAHGIVISLPVESCDGIDFDGGALTDREP